jgi:site-specific DNA-methyltransferase (adenine-specific)
MNTFSLSHADCLDWLPTLPSKSVNLIATDPPYYRVKSESWDRQWKTPKDYLSWLDKVLKEFQRVLAPNGSLYLFASPQMAARVECLVAERFDVLNRITWRKPPYSTKAEMFVKGDLRSFFPASEAIIFAEQIGSDSEALGYDRKCDQLRGFVFEPLRAYLDGERRRAGVRHREVISRLGMSGHDSHFFSPIQWKLPLERQYEEMRALFNEKAGGLLTRPYGCLQREYESLRSEYESLRRPFSVSADVPYTDVWDFKTVPHRPGKHVCEKPLDLCRHIVRSSSRAGDTVLDAFCGSGSMGEAALLGGRNFVGCEKDEVWAESAGVRLGMVGQRKESPTRTLKRVLPPRKL